MYENQCWAWSDGFIRSQLMWLYTVFIFEWCAHSAYSKCIPGCVAQSVTCLTTDTCLTADPGVTSLILAWSHTFVEIDPEMISTAIFLTSSD